MEMIYTIARFYINFFQPTMKLCHKTRHGAKVYKVYEKAKTPYQRLLEWDVLTDAKRVELGSIYTDLNPVLLLKQLNGYLEQLWRLTDRTPVTGIMQQQGGLR
jgi:hypothetical protein